MSFIEREDWTAFCFPSGSIKKDFSQNRCLIEEAQCLRSNIGCFQTTVVCLLLLSPNDYSNAFIKKMEYDEKKKPTNFRTHETNE